ncbi:acyl-CoA synthetase [Haloactinomyces albus]|uniref:Acyl-CoA synthetase (AMP-forming)/AMP-acid ligase II n=1 Tax=Haloactinomyces albus TaxID=1352928 RepID=A0AAE3ZDD4_9ACTN|nr:long-chain fatty acid--CoA ligase [Haloactinomyces albus]MDR7301613.1 acyl-CoA synthetase (AMP-forming)/AMP-acid ligase II [Haloactinomyces albus]
MNVARFLNTGVAKAGTAAAIVYRQRVITYPELLDRVARLASGLAALGVERGDRVVLLLPNRPELVELLWASFHGGFVAVPVNWHLHPDEVGYIVEDSEATLLVVADETAAAAHVVTDHVRVLHLADSDTGGADYEELLHAEPSPVAPTDSEAPAWLFYTSGTTGKPKGAVLTHRNLEAMSAAYHQDLDPVAEDSRYLHAAPLTHGSGLYLLPATARGATNVIAPGLRFSAGDYLDLVEQHRITHAAFLAPTMLNRLLDEAPGRDLTSLRSIVVGGAPLYREDLRAAVAAFGPIIVQMYGQGESPMTITVMPPHEALGRPGSCGRPFSTVDVRVLGADDRPMPDGVDGEVCVRGDVVMAGYWNNPAATTATLVDGWLHTGDIGRFADGYLHLTDRAKDVIITGGSNVYPREVEEVLLGHPAVREAAVVGIPDPEWGESVRAFVVTTPGPTEKDLIDHCRAHTASFKKPRDVVFVGELPKNATGKILRRELKTSSSASTPDTSSSATSREPPDSVTSRLHAKGHHHDPDSRSAW